MSIDDSPLGDLPEGWTLARLANIARPIGSGATPRGGSAVYLSYREKYALVRSQNVFDRRFDNDGLAFISDAAAEELSGASLDADDLLLNITGDGVTFGRACMVPRGVLPACVNQHVVRIRCDRKKCEPAYLLSYLTHPMVKHYIEGFNAGGSRRAITKGHIESFVVPLPPLPEQRAIARVLGGLDDKIELNRRMNRTLEDLARGLFRSWFVDFDPVLRPAPGPPSRPPSPPPVPPARRGGPASPAPRSAPAAPAPPHAPWPTRLTDSPLGPIPEGWRVGTVAEIGTNPRRGVLPSEVDATTPYIGLEHMPRRCIALDDWGTAADVSSGKSRFSRGEILFGKLRPYFHKVGVALIDGVCSTDVIVAAPKKECWFGVLLGHLSSDEFIDYVDGASGGTRMPRTSWGDMARYQIVIPPEPVAASYSVWMRQVADMLRIHAHESRALAALRDALLPQLLSGEIRLREADRAVDDALRSTGTSTPQGRPARPGAGTVHAGAKGRA